MAVAVFGVAAYCDEEEDEVDEELVVSAPAPEFCEREENLLAPECSGVLEDPHSDESSFLDTDQMSDDTGGGGAMPNNAQDEDGDEIQDCWSDLTSNENAEITSSLGYRGSDGDGVAEDFHNGTDIGVATGTRLYAAKSGDVVATETRLAEGSSSYVNEHGETVEVPNGNFIRIDWDDGTQGVFLHMETVRGDLINDSEVSVGDYLGRSNDTGLSDGPHLHYSEWRDQSTDRPDNAADDPDNFNDPEDTHDDCEGGEGEGTGGE